MKRANFINVIYSSILCMSPLFHWPNFLLQPSGPGLVPLYLKPLCLLSKLFVFTALFSHDLTLTGHDRAITTLICVPQVLHQVTMEVEPWFGFFTIGSAQEQIDSKIESIYQYVAFKILTTELVCF